MNSTIRFDGPVAERFTQAGPDNFAAELAARWEAIDRIKARVAPALIAEVEQGNLSTAEGLAVMAGLTGQLLGYEHFHGPASGTDMLETLRPSVERATADR